MNQIQKSLSNSTNKYVYRNRTEAFKKALKSNYKIISTGGSVPCNKKNRDLLKNSNNIVIWLNISYEEVNKRINGMEGAIKRGVCFDNNIKNLLDLYNFRYKYYKECSTYEINNINITETLCKIENVLDL